MLKKKIPLNSSIRSDFWVMKGIWVLAVAFSFVLGSLVTGASVYAQQDGGSFLCPVGQALTGIIFEKNDKVLDFICQTTIPETYIRTATDYASNDNDASVTLGCDEGDIFLSGGAFGEPRANATPLAILISGPQVNSETGQIEWYATARFPDTEGGIDLIVNVTCLNTNP